MTTIFGNIHNITYNNEWTIITKTWFHWNFINLTVTRQHVQNILHWKMKKIKIRVYNKISNVPRKYMHDNIAQKIISYQRSTILNVENHWSRLHSTSVLFYFIQANENVCYLAFIIFLIYFLSFVINPFLLPLLLRSLKTRNGRVICTLMSSQWKLNLEF